MASQPKDMLVFINGYEKVSGGTVTHSATQDMDDDTSKKHLQNGGLFKTKKNQKTVVQFLLGDCTINRALRFANPPIDISPNENCPQAGTQPLPSGFVIDYPTAKSFTLTIPGASTSKRHAYRLNILGANPTMDCSWDPVIDNGGGPSRFLAVLPAALGLIALAGVAYVAGAFRLLG